MTLSEKLSLSPAFVQDRTVLAGTQDGILKSTDAGASWRALPFGAMEQLPYIVEASPASPSPYPYPEIPYIVEPSPDYHQDQTIFAAMKDGRVLKSIDGGVTWSSIRTGGSGEGVSLAFSPHYSTDKTILAGYDGKGAFVSRDAGQTWKDLNQGLGNLGIKTLQIVSQNCAVLFAGTERGIWRYPLSNCLDSDPQVVTVMANAGAAEPVSRTLTVLGREGGVITYTASISPTVDWLRVSSAPAATTPATTTLSIGPSGQLTGTYLTNLILAASQTQNSPLIVPVKMVIGAISRLYLPVIGHRYASGW